MDDILNAVNTSGIGGEIGKELTNKMLPLILDKFSPLITIFKIVGIVVLIYIIFLIIKAVMNIRFASRIKKIAKNVSEINEKLDVLVGKKAKPEKEKKK